MNLTKSSNPVFGKSVFNKVQAGVQTDVMTIEGTINKTGLMFLILAFAAAFTWRKFFGVFDYGSAEGAFSIIAPWMIGGGIGGFIIAMITVFTPRYSNITAPIYAVFEGLFLGGISAFFEAQYPGLVVRAVALTFGVFLVMLFLFRSGKIRATGKFRMGVLAATGGIALIYFVSFIASFFGANFNFLYGNGMMGIGFSLVVVTIAALNLILDFDFIQRGADARAPKIMEWYGAFGLMVTLVWLYIEILRLLSKLASRR